MNLSTHIEISYVNVWNLGRWESNVAEVEDQGGLVFGPGCGALVRAHAGLRRRGVKARFVGCGHCVALVFLVFGMHCLMGSLVGR